MYNPKRKAVAYARFSSDNQRDESIDAQLRAINEYAEKNNYEITEHYIDRARSATTAERPEFLRMIKDSADRTFDVVIVHKLDRFARNRYDSAKFKYDLKKNGVMVISVLENIDGSPESVILEGVVEAFAEYYSKNLSRETKKGLKENALKGVHNGGTPPLGYTIDPNTKKLVVVPAEAEAVRIIFKNTINGVGYTETIYQLNELGYKTKSGRPFGKNSIFSILKNEKYIGRYVYGKVRETLCGTTEPPLVIENNHEAIISQEDFDKVQVIMGTRKHHKTKSNAVLKENYLLSGIIKCGSCGASYSGNRHRSSRDKKFHVTYRCCNKHSHTNIVCRNKEVNKPKLETIVLKLLADLVFSPEQLARVKEEFTSYVAATEGDHIGLLQALEKEFSAADKKKQNLINVIASTGNTSLVDALNKVEFDQDVLKQQISSLKLQLSEKMIANEKIEQAFVRAKDMFVSNRLKHARELILLFVESVIVRENDVVITINETPMLETKLLKEHIFTRQEVNSIKTEEPVVQQKLTEQINNHK